MARFRFRLDKVLRYRTHLEKKARLQLCDAVNRVKEQETLLLRLARQRVEAARGLADERSQGISGYRDEMHTSFLRGLAEQMAQAREELEKARQRLEVLKTLLMLATMKKKILESLKEEQGRRFTEASGKREQKLLDDLVILGRERQEL